MLLYIIYVLKKKTSNLKNHKQKHPVTSQHVTMFTHHKCFMLHFVSRVVVGGSTFICAISHFVLGLVHAPRQCYTEGTYCILFAITVGSVSEIIFLDISLWLLFWDCIYSFVVSGVAAATGCHRQLLIYACLLLQNCCNCWSV